MLSRLAYALRSRLRPPNVFVDVVHEDGLIFVVLHNMGGGPAEHVAVTFKPDIRALRGTVPLSELALFRDLPFLPPGKSIRAFLDVGPAYFAREAPTRFTTTVRFQSEHGASFRRTSTHNLAVYQHLGFVDRSSARPTDQPIPSRPPSASR